jgi:hypothetical protein
MATLCSAVFDGLLLELLSTGDRRRTTEALRLFIAHLQESPSGMARVVRPGVEA